MTQIATTDPVTVYRQRINDQYLTGLNAGRPAAGTDGRWYKETDSKGLIFRDNAASWDPVPIGESHFDKIGVSTDATARRGKSIIATTESRTNAAFGTLTTPDQVSVTVPTDGLIAVAYQATWQESVAGAGQAAIFIGANQLKLADTFRAPQVQAANTAGATAAIDHALSSSQMGLVSAANNGVSSPPAYPGDVTTGQAIGIFDSTAPHNIGIYYFGGGQNVDSVFPGGPCWIFAAAGTYAVSVQFKASSGSVTAKNRKLWVWTLGF